MNDPLLTNPSKGLQLNARSWSLYTAIADFQSWQCVALGVWCCDRVVHHYRTFATSHGSPDTEKLERGLDRLWMHALGEKLKNDEYAHWDKVYHSMFGSGERESELAGWHDAVSVLASFLYTLRTCMGDQAAWAVRAANSAREPMFQRLWRALRPISQPLPPTETKVRLDSVHKHPEMQAQYEWEDILVAFLRAQIRLDAADRRRW